MEFTLYKNYQIWVNGEGEFWFNLENDFTQSPFSKGSLGEIKKLLDKIHFLKRGVIGYTHAYQFSEFTLTDNIKQNYTTNRRL